MTMPKRIVMLLAFGDTFGDWVKHADPNPRLLNKRNRLFVEAVYNFVTTNPN